MPFYNGFVAMALLNWIVVMSSLQWLCCDSFCFSRSTMFTNKAITFLEAGYTGIYRPVVKDF